MAGNPVVPGGINQPHNLPPSAATPVGRRWGMDEIVVAAFAFFGVGGAVFLPLRYGFNMISPIQVSFLLATGLAALTYRFLGGIEGASFKIGALKLTGTLAALVGIALVINNQLEKQTSAQVWYVNGTVLDERKNPFNQLHDGDLLVVGNARAEQLGNFHVEFIRHPAEPAEYKVYLNIQHIDPTPQHKDFGPITIPLQLDALKAVYPKTRVEGKVINFDPVLPPNATQSAPPTQPTQILTTPQPLTPEQRQGYNASAQTARPADPAIGGVPQ